MSDTEGNTNEKDNLFENTGAKPRKCAKCGQPCRGHNGPYGKDCEMFSTEPQGHETLLKSPPSVSSNMLNDAQSPDLPRQEQSANQARFMEQLLIQMANLNVNMHALVRGQSELKTIIDGQHVVSSSSAQQPCVTDADRTRATNQQPSSGALHPAGTSSTHTSVHENINTNKCNSPEIQEPGSFTVIPNGSRVENKTIRAVKKGEFINLAEFLPLSDMPNQIEIEPIVDSSGKVVFQQKRNNNILDSFTKWLRAWNNYECLMMEQQPKLYTELASYRNFIQSCVTHVHPNLSPY